MSLSGGHTYVCGHVKHCGDHVKMVHEATTCNVCGVIKEALKAAGLPGDTRQVAKAADVVFASNLIGKEPTHGSPYSW